VWWTMIIWHGWLVVQSSSTCLIIIVLCIDRVDLELVVVCDPISKKLFQFYAWKNWWANVVKPINYINLSSNNWCLI